MAATYTAQYFPSRHVPFTVGAFLCSPPKTKGEGSDTSPSGAYNCPPTWRPSGTTSPGGQRRRRGPNSRPTTSRYTSLYPSYSGGTSHSRWQGPYSCPSALLAGRLFYNSNRFFYIVLSFLAFSGLPRAALPAPGVGTLVPPSWTDRGLPCTLQAIAVLRRAFLFAGVRRQADTPPYGRTVTPARRGQ